MVKWLTNITVIGTIGNKRHHRHQIHFLHINQDDRCDAMVTKFYC